MPSTHYSCDVPIAPPTDVLVVGSGPSGLGAAIAAARNGVSVRMIERFGFLGGNLTAGLVGPCMTSFSLDGKTQLVRGIFDEFVCRMEIQGGALHPSKTKSGSQYSGFMVFGHEAVTPFDPEVAKVVAMQMCREAGVDLVLHSFVVDTRVENGAATGVITASKSGLSLIPASVIIDCSGDGDVAARGDAKFEYGRPQDGEVQPMTLFFRVTGVDDAAVERYRREHPEDYFPYQGIVEQAQRDGNYDLPRRGVQLFKTLDPGVWRINTTRVLGVDGTNVNDLTRAELAARDQVLELMRFFHAELPGLQNCTLLDTAATIGVRESRRIVGEHVLTLDELVEGHHFPDVIAVAGYPVDIHNPVSTAGPFDDEIPATANIYEIPYRSLVPESLDGVLMSGRCVSATHEALAAVRVMPPSFAMGEAAGTAAAQAVASSVQPRAVDVTKLQDQLVAQGAYLGPAFETEAVH
ncbi:FAD-dependent oxidoreductase [Mycobacterium sp. 21AC1]|uniref:FAD-dependent oxidoreductase n=1 Tax=[Mycobacterium] appelbergii TaxID=2939269 RepID=UPI002938F8D9|nr:FAD-dependent oxidoreductase [Mycobacterium sp. 21AC1]MDV3123542.1 FAD-dependent oxidoreductase [Mycobacterium sp. 21AC1]